MYFRLDTALQSRARKIDEMNAIIDNAEQRGGLSRSNRSQIAALETEIAELDEKITEAREARPLTTSNLAAEGEGLGLKRGQSMQKWAEQRGGYFGAAGDGIDDSDASEMNLGSIVRAMVTGRRDGMSDAEKRTLSEGVDSAGGFLTPEILATRLIDRVRNAGKVFAAGATTVPLDSDTVALARLVTGVAPTWKAENDPVAVSDMTFDRLTFKPKTLPVLVKLSQELFDDLSPEATRLIENEVAKAIALEVDRAALYGDGTGATPLGIKGRSADGVVLTAFGGANGATPTNYDFILDGFQTLRGGNFEPNGVMLAPRTDRTLAGLKDSQGRYLDPPPSYNDVPKYATNQIPTNLTVGTSNGVCSDAFVGEWENLLIGFRPSLQLRVKTLQERFADTMQVGLLVWIRADVQLAHGAAFNVISGIKP